MADPTAADVRRTLYDAVTERTLDWTLSDDPTAAQRVDGLIAAHNATLEIDTSLSLGAYVTQLIDCVHALRQTVIAEGGPEDLRLAGIRAVELMIEELVIAPLRASGALGSISQDLQELVLSHVPFLKSLHAHQSLAPLCGVIDAAGEVGGYALTFKDESAAQISVRGALAQLVRDTRAQLRDRELRAVGVFFHGVISDEGYRVADSVDEANAILGWLEDVDGQGMQMSLRYRREAEDAPWEYQSQPQLSQGGPLPMLVRPTVDWYLPSRSDDLGAVTGADLSGTHALVSFGIGGVIELDLAEGDNLRNMPLPDGYAVVALSAASHQCLVTEPDGAVALYSFPDFELVCGFNPRQSPIRSITMDPGARLAVACLANGEVSFFDLVGRTVAEYKSLSTDLVGCAISRDATRVLTTSREGSVETWGVRDGVPETQQPHQMRTMNPAIARLSDTGRFGAWAERGGSLETADFRTGMAFAIGGPERRVVTADISGDGQLLAVHCENGDVEIWDGVQRQGLDTLHPTTPLTVLRFAPDGNRVLCGQADGSVALVRVLPR